MLSTHEASEHQHGLFIDLPPLRPALTNAALLLLEAIVVPTAIFAVLLPVAGLTWALLGSLGWCWATVALRMARRRGTPGTLLLTTSMFTARTVLALVTSSAFVYLAQPIVGSVCMAALFVGSAMAGRPLTLRLARDFVHVPAHLIDRARVRRMFRDVAILWGLSRVVTALLSFQMLRVGTDAGLFARGVVSPLVTVLAVAVCTWWGWRSLRADGVRLRVRPAALPVAA